VLKIKPGMPKYKLFMVKLRTAPYISNCSFGEEGI
jgi:hypothetical protein